jgi:hypothetical protein
MKGMSCKENYGKGRRGKVGELKRDSNIAQKDLWRW